MGFCSQMELRAGTQDLLENIEFAESIPQEAAERALAQRFYKSQQIDWGTGESGIGNGTSATKAYSCHLHRWTVDG